MKLTQEAFTTCPKLIGYSVSACGFEFTLAGEEARSLDKAERNPGRTEFLSCPRVTLRSTQATVLPFLARTRSLDKA